MEYSKIKNTDLNVSRICMGGCPMGGYGWGAVQEAELIDAVQTALDNGISYSGCSYSAGDVYAYTFETPNLPLVILSLYYLYIVSISS